MKILLIRSVGIRGEGHSEGEELNLPRDEAMTLVNIGKAVCNDAEVEEGLSPEEEKIAKREAEKKSQSRGKAPSQG